MNILEIKDVFKQYGKFTVLNHISLSVPEGSIYGLLGPNGAGKTSLIRIITQITAPDSGEIIFKGEKLSPRHSGMIGYLPEERGLYKKMKVGEQLLYLSRLKGMSKQEAETKLEKWITKFGIEDWIKKNIEDLSKGMQQKVQFIATVMHEPPLIILDEPFTGFDPINVNLLRKEILELKKKGTTIIFSTHRMESVEDLCDYMSLIYKAEIILEGSKKEIKADAKTNIYLVEGNGALGNLPEGYTIDHFENEEEGEFKAEIKINGGSASELIRYLTEKIVIHSFKEKVPSMNEIFIHTIQNHHK